MVPHSPEEDPARQVQLGSPIAEALDARPGSVPAGHPAALTALLAAGLPEAQDPGPEPAAAAQERPGLQLVGAELRGADLAGAQLDGVDLSGADLEGADLSGASLRGANLDGACLNEAKLQGTDLVGASLVGAKLRHMDADGIDLTRTNLEGADLARSSMRGGRLFGARVAGAHFERVDLHGGFLAGMRGYEKAQWKNVDIRDVDLNGTYLSRRFIADQNYIHEFRSRGGVHELTYYLWWLTSDCGRSVMRWGLLTLFLMVAFAKVYTHCEIDYGPYETALSPFYFSVVTLTTLGFGDVLPSSTFGQVLVMIEVTLGYVMLGGLLSIFSTKMARRAE